MQLLHIGLFQACNYQLPPHIHCHNHYALLTWSVTMVNTQHLPEMKGSQYSSPWGVGSHIRTHTHAHKLARKRMHTHTTIHTNPTNQLKLRLESRVCHHGSIVQRSVAKPVKLVVVREMWLVWLVIINPVLHSLLSDVVMGSLYTTCTNTCHHDC